MKTSDLRLKTLEIVRENEICGYDIHKKLTAQGTVIDIGRLYKVLTAMLTEGLLGSRWEKSEKGPEKRVYRLSEKGRSELYKTLQEAIETVHMYYSEYLMNLPSGKSLFEAFAKMIANNGKKSCRMTFFASKPSPLHGKIISAIQKEIPKIEIYVVHPKDINLNLNNNGIVFLNGAYSVIPLKDSYIDLLVIEGLPKNENFGNAAREWFRVLSDNSKLVIIAPSVLVSGIKDPLGIGDFVEKMEHQNNSGEFGKGEILINILKKQFQTIEKRQMLQMTILEANKRKNIDA